MTRVLLVEDNLSLLDNISFNLEMRGYDIIQSYDGQEALNVMRTLQDPPDIIVSDIAMPNLNGYQLLEAVHAEQDWNGIPFIFLTAFDSHNAIQMGKELGADDYLVKPFNPDELIIAIENKLRMVERFRSDAERRMERMRKDLIMLISHEIRTPLTSIYGGSEMLNQNLDRLPMETVQTLVGVVRSGAKRLNHLVSQIVFLLRVDCGQAADMYRYKAQPHELASLIDRAREGATYDLEAATASVNFLVTEHNTPIYIKGVADFLVLAFGEILRNAVTFSLSGGDIKIDLYTEGDMAYVSIEDQGVGIDPNALDRVWERFVQLNRDEYEQQGAGLGLAIVRETARVHGGDCFIEPLECGTRVIFSLPLLPEE